MITMDNIHGGSWKKLQNWATGIFLKKTADSDLNMNGNDITNPGNLYTQAQVNSTFMKKTADSDLDMNGYDITNINTLISRLTSGASATSEIIPVGEYFWHKMGLASGGYDDTLKAMLKNLCIDYADAPNYSIFIGSVRYSSRTFFIAQIDSTSTVDATTGLPSYCKGIVLDYNKNNIHRFGTSNYVYSRTLFQGFDDSDSSKNYAINAFGSNYIRYENGLQICWGSVSREVSATGAWGNIFSGGISNAINFDVSFTSAPSVSASVNDSSFTVGRLVRSASAITGLELYRGSSASATSVTVSYIAIGKWK